MYVQSLFAANLKHQVLLRLLEQLDFLVCQLTACKLGSGHSHHSLPVMFKPQLQVKEFSSESQWEQYQQRMQAVYSSSRTFKGMKHNLLASLLLPEVSGPWLTFQTLARSFATRRAGSFFRKTSGKSALQTFHGTITQPYRNP